MKNILAFCLALVATTSFAATYSEVNENEFLLNRFSPQNAAKAQLGTAVEKMRLRSQKCIWDYTLSGATTAGATTGSLKNDLKQPCTVPKNGIIRDILVDLITPVTGGTSPQAPLISIGYTGATTAFLAATGLNVMGVVTPHAFLPGAIVSGGATTTALKLTADQTVLMTVVGSTLFSGKFNVLIMSQMSD